MGERKVLINYISPDFDPSLIPKHKRDKNEVHEIRTMLPFSMRCERCGEFMYKGARLFPSLYLYQSHFRLVLTPTRAGTKFNSKKEMVKGDTYMGIRKFRFYIKCVVCSNEIAFKTDPKNSDYEMESGASRNFEIWKDNSKAIVDMEQQQEEEEKVDNMKALENRALDSKLEMDVLDALDEMKAINQRHERIDADEVLSSINRMEQERQQLNYLLSAQQVADEEAIIRSIRFKSSARAAEVIMMEGEGEVGSADSAGSSSSSSGAADLLASSMREKRKGETAERVVPVAPLIIKRRKGEPPVSTHASASEPTETSSAMSSLLGGYDSD